MSVVNCCGKRKTSSVTDLEMGKESGGRKDGCALLVRLWRCLASGETASFVLLARNAPDLNGPRPAAAQSPSGDACPGIGCGVEETLLIRACSLNAATEVRTLLDLGADPNQLCGSGSPALHHCVSVDAATCVRVLLANSRTDVNAQSPQGFDALHYSAHDPSWEIKDKESRLECIKLLLQHPNFHPNKVNRWGQTPIICAVQRFFEERVKVMLEYGRNRIDLDWRMYAGQSIRSELHHKFPKLPMPPRKIENRLSEDKNIRLLAYLQVKDTESFKVLLKKESIDLNYFYSDPYYCTILELACRVPGYEDFVQLILQRGGDPNTKNKIDGNPLIHQAAECANDKVLKMLLATESVDICVLNKTYAETALHVATQSISPQEEEIEAMENTINLLLDYKNFSDVFSETEPSHIDINAEDEGGDTALHNATYFGLDSISLLLLRRGASMTKENVLGYAPIAYIGQSALQTHLDSQVDSNGMSPQNDYFELIFRYDTLVSTPNDDDNLAEMKAMNYLVNSEDLRPTLLHPLVRTFLYLKWHNVKNFFMYNLLLYLLFVISLTTYSVLLNVDISEKEDNVTCFVIITEQEQSTIDQSLNTSQIITLNETLLQSTPVFPMNTTLTNTTSCEYLFTDIHKVMRIIIISLRTLLSLFLLFLLIREGSQLIILKREYFISIENIMEILLILGTTIVILSPYLDELVVRHICGVVILLAWTELILLSGRLPALSIQLEMFKKVCVTFVRFMAWYSLIILAFAFSFFVLLRGNDKFFLNPGISIVKTVVMLAGEFEASDLEFTNAPGTSHVIFLLFVCLIAIVLLNLLNGLAVYDTQAIKDDATILSLVSMVRLVNYIEEFLLKLLIFSKLCKLERLENYFKKKLQLFDPKIHKKQIHVFPQGGEIRFLLDAETTKRFDEYKLSQVITDATIDIVIKKNQDTEFKKMKDAFTYFSEKIMSMEESLKVLISNGKH